MDRIKRPDQDDNVKSGRTLTGYWLPPALWMGFIFWLSTDQFSATTTGSTLERLLELIGVALSPGTLIWVHFGLRKLAHLTGYAILALLLFRALRSGSKLRWNFRWAVGAFVILGAYALLDEYHQSFTAHRTGSLIDSVIDMVGGLAALAGRRLSLNSRRAQD
ncbi:MAG: VanZ family protein [Acidobacteriota bacterium]